MPEHIHGCLQCRPDMVPQFDRADPRYHDNAKCGVPLQATVDGVAPGYHKGVFAGPDGWVLLAGEGFDAGLCHACPNCTIDGDDEGAPTVERYETCVEPRFGRVEVVHDCPAWRPRR